MLVRGQWVADYMRLLWWEHPSFSHKTRLLAKVLNTCCLLTHALRSPAGFEWHDITKTHESVVTSSQYWKISLRPHFVTILFQFIISFLFSLTLSGRIGRRGKRIVCDAMNTYVKIISWCQGMSHVCTNQWQYVRGMDCDNCYKMWPLLAFYLSLRAFPYFSAITVAKGAHCCPLCQ